MENSINVEGRAVPWGSGDEEREKKWRKKIYEKIIEEKDKIKCDFNKFKITIKFYMLSKGNQPDIDNLAKSVLDTLFTDKHEKEKYPKGALTEKDDNKVYGLILEKHDCNETEQKIEIIIEEFKENK